MRRWRAFAAMGAVVATGAFAQGVPAEERQPFRAHSAVHAPERLTFGLEHRARVERLEDDFRPAARGPSQGLFLRTLLGAELKAQPVGFRLELLDARAYVADGTPLNTGLANPIDLLQAHLTLAFGGILEEGDALRVKAGRMTADLGSRRLLARNEYRNTINGFTGVDATYTRSSRAVLRAFAFVPVQRLPSDASELEQNALGLDHENLGTLFGGVAWNSAPLPGRFRVEPYVLGLLEEDREGAASANRRLVTPGFRLIRAPSAGTWDLTIEAMMQAGRSRASTSSNDERDLTHLATSAHVSAGWRFAVPWSPRVSAIYDWASGDADPTDDRNGRFDTLFGARRFDFGPTGLYGPFARANLSSPALRVDGAPHRTVDAFVAWRAAWLASPRDAWTTAGVRDASGESGSFLGHQLEVRARWAVLPGNVALEAGGAYLAGGDFRQSAPGATGGEPLYLYTQLTGTL